MCFFASYNLQNGLANEENMFNLICLILHSIFIWLWQNILGMYHEVMPNLSVGEDTDKIIILLTYVE